MTLGVEGIAGLWLAVIASGIYHGLNPGMGWPLAVSAALMEQRPAALWPALGALAAGHLVAMLAILLPFAALVTLVTWQQEIQVGAAGMLVVFGLWLLITNRHPRFLARVPPSRLGLWSFLVAIAHGAALMLVPIYLGICGIEVEAGDHGVGHLAAGTLMAHGLIVALAVAIAHTAAMVASGGALAYGVHRWLGLRFLRQGWFDLDRVWALSLIGVGILAIALAS
ncbi:MAG: hypothetical protein AAFZ09_13540 [Pseudomonadota bacterium]